MKLRKVLSVVLIALLLAALAAPALAYAAPPCTGSHHWVDSGQGTKPTCTTPGVRYLFCADCGAQDTRTVAALGHDWTLWKTVREATCTREGERRRQCEHCGLVSEYALDKLPHAFGEWTVTREATPDSRGERQRACGMCGRTETEYFDMEALPEGDTPPAQASGPELRVEKRAVNAPQDARGYRPGEGVTYGIAVTNRGAQPSPAFDVCDPLKGANEDAALELDVILAPGETREYTFVYGVTGEDALRGAVENTAYISWWDEAHGLMEILSNTVTVPVLNEYENAVTALKREISLPANPSGYAPGEEITYEIAFTNNAGMPLWADVRDPLAASDLNPVGYLAMDLHLAPGASLSQTFIYTVTAGDAENGRVENTATVDWRDTQDFSGLLRGEARTNSVVVPVIPEGFENPPGEGENARITVTKRAVSTPQNAGGYAPGETVTYEIIATNRAEIPLWADLQDILAVNESANPTGYLAMVVELIPGASLVETLNYTVTEKDAQAGYVDNTAVVWWHNTADFSGDMRGEARSNTVRVPALAVWTVCPPSAGGTIEVFKREISAPANGEAYLAGEEIEYQIDIVNHADGSVFDVELFDSLAADFLYEDSFSIGIISEIVGRADEAGNVAQAFFRHIVTPADEHAGYVSNQAMAAYADGGKRAYSNVVVSPCGARTDGSAFDLPPITPPDVSGAISLAAAFAGEEEGYAPCARKLTYKSEYDEEVLLHLCPLHAPARRAVLEKVNAAASDEEKLAAWRDARDVWQGELEALYTRCLEASTGGAVAVVINEKALFAARMSAYEAILAQAYPDDPLRAAQLAAQALMNRAAELCGEMHTAPDNRPDSRAAGDYTRVQGMSLGLKACARKALGAPGDDARELVIFCDAHSAADQAAQALWTDRATDAQAFEACCESWKAQLDGEIRALYPTLSGEGRRALAAECAVYGAWLEWRARFLALLYPGRPEVAAEALMNELMNQTLDLCALAAR